MTGNATTALDARTGQRAPNARPEFEQRRHHCQGSKPDQFCDTSQGKHTQASTEKDCKLADKSDPPPCRARAEAEEIRTVRLKELEEMVAKLLVATGKLPAVQDRHNF